MTVDLEGGGDGRQDGVATSKLRSGFDQLLSVPSAELLEDDPRMMSTGALLPTPDAIDEGDLELFFQGLEAGLIRLCRGGRFNTFDRPTGTGHWALLSRSKEGGWYNAEYLPQMAAYVDAILRLGFPKERVLFELPPRGLQLDLAILDDLGRVVVLGEAKRAASMLGKLADGIVEGFGDVAPDEGSKLRGDEVRQLAWRVWTIEPQWLWLIGPGTRQAFRCKTAPLRLEAAGVLPSAAQLELDHRPPRPLAVPDLTRARPSSSGRGRTGPTAPAEDKSSRDTLR